MIDFIFESQNQSIDNLEFLQNAQVFFKTENIIKQKKSYYSDKSQNKKAIQLKVEKKSLGVYYAM